MSHQFTFIDETPEVVRFTCAICGCPIEFSQPGIGEPAAFKDLDGQWQTPINPDQWAGKPCT